MRRAAVHLSVAALAFLAGLLAHRLWPARAPSPKKDGPAAVSFCELARDPWRYDGKVVRVRAVLHSDFGYPFIYDWSCGPPDSRTSPLVVVYDHAALPQWSVRTRCGGDDRRCVGPVSVEAVVVGTFQADKFVSDATPGTRHPHIDAGAIFAISAPAENR